jgi:hypothetical protein
MQVACLGGVMLKDHHVMLKEHHVMLNEHHVMLNDYHVMLNDYHVMLNDYHVMLNLIQHPRRFSVYPYTNQGPNPPIRPLTQYL